MMRGFWLKLSHFALLFFLTACMTPRLDVAVKSFHQWGTNQRWQDKSYTIHYDADNLEQKYYADLLSRYLAASGARVIPAHADYTIKANFQTQKNFYPESRPIYSDTGFWVSGRYVEANHQIYYQSPYWVSTGIQITDYHDGLQMVFAHILQVNIYTAKAKKIFEAKAVLNSYQNDMNRYAPYLIESIFRDFPGNNGELRFYRYDPKAPLPFPPPAVNGPQIPSPAAKDNASRGK